jgi:hypothetical protein
MASKEFLTMAKNENKRIAPGVLQADRESYAALQTVPGYTPNNPTFSLIALQSAQTEMNGAQTLEAQAAANLAVARDAAVAKEWEFHNLVLGMRDQVVAQFGRDAPEVQAVGLKRVSERKPRVRRTPVPTP